MKQSQSLSSLPLRFQKLLSVTVLAYIVLYGVMLAVQQFAIQGVDVSVSLRVSDLVSLAATAVAPIAMFVAGYRLVPNGSRWHRLTAGSVATVAGQIITQPIMQFGQLFTSLPIFASPYVYVGLSLGATVVALGALLLIVARPQLWRRRSELLVWLTVAAFIVLLVVQLVYASSGDRAAAYALAGVVGPLVFAGLALAVVYRALRPLPKVERLFRAILVITATMLAASTTTFILMSIAQYFAMSDVESVNAALVFLPYVYMAVAAGVFVSGVWFARPKRTDR